ncbi:MAG: hypothetical protein V1678_01430 [Candidatus Aenigmatarchaeota archaeon]
MKNIIFWIGIAKIAVAAILLLAVEEDLGIWPMSMGILGIVFIGSSGYRPMAQRKK